MFEQHGDEDGHREAIEATRDLLRRSLQVRAKLGEANEFRGNVLDLLERRHRADYDPYGTNTPNERSVDFPVAAQEALRLAGRVLEKVREYITQKEADVL